MKIHMPDTSHMVSLRTLWKEAFGDTDVFLDTFFRTAYSHERCRVMTIDDNVVAALYWFDCSYNCQPNDNKRIAYIYAVATATSSRRQGLCHKLMKDTHEHFKNTGYDGALLVPANDKLFSFYEKMGYKVCCHIDELVVKDICDNYNCQAGTITEINKDEFAKRRHTLLPERSVIQEKENLDFLETQAKFFTGRDFLLSARTESDTLYGLELLGDTSVAPFIVHALGCSNGIFRTPGSNKPFAMYLSFADNGSDAGVPPSYFAFAFD